MQNIGRFVPAWALATMLGMVTIGTLVFLLMWPTFGFMDALILGMTAGVLEAVPYLGPIFSVMPALLLVFGEGRMTLLWVVLAYVLVQVLENNVILPFIMVGSRAGAVLKSPFPTPATTNPACGFPALGFHC